MILALAQAGYGGIAKSKSSLHLTRSVPCLHLDTCRYNPIKTIKTSFIGTMNMLGLAKRTRARFLLTSTSEVWTPPSSGCALPLRKLSLMPGSMREARLPASAATPQHWN